MTFHDHSKQIVEDYLGTVAYVDDLIFSSGKEIQPEVITTTTTTLREVAAKEEPVKEEAVQVVQTPTRNIDPLTITNAFREKGIHCALLEVTNDGDSLDSIKKTIIKSDIIILDWQMHYDKGAKATELLLSAIDGKENAELRLIVVFTDEPKPLTILSDVIEPKLKEQGVNNIHFLKNGRAIRFGHTKIVILEKENGNKTKNSVSDEKLPERIIEEFTELTEGLVSNASLESIIAVRRNTHRLLANFNRNLDPAYLSHKSLLPHTPDSKEHITDLLGSEIKSIIKLNSKPNENEILQLYFKERFDGWSSDFLIENREKLTIEIPEKLNGEMLHKLAEVGVENFFYTKETPQDQKDLFARSCHKNLTACFTGNAEVAARANIEFAILTTIKSLTDKSEKILTQGTILKEDKSKNPNYWLCVQPKCDSNRIETQRRDFLFLRLYKGREDRFDIILFDGEKLVIDYRVYKSSLIPFKTNGSNRIISFEENGDLKFLQQNNQKMIWKAELKNDFAQHISNTFASKLSRVGMDHSEWLRRS